MDLFYYFNYNKTKIKLFSLTFKEININDTKGFVNRKKTKETFK